MSKRKSKEDPDWVPEAGMVAGMVAGRVTGSKNKVDEFDIMIPKRKAGFWHTYDVYNDLVKPKSETPTVDINYYCSWVLFSFDVDGLSYSSWLLTRTPFFPTVVVQQLKEARRGREEGGQGLRGTTGSRSGTEQCVPYQK